MSDFATVLPATAYGYFTNNTATLSIDLVITNTATFSWNGITNGVPVGYWDIGGTPDWKSAGAPVVYTTASNARFDDSAAGTKTVNVTTAIAAPTTIFTNNTPYTLTGAGSISGSGGLTKSGSGTLTVANANTFTGPVTINGGTVKIGTGNGLPVTAAVTLGNVAGATLDLNGQNQTIASLAGTGPNGEVKLGSGILTVGGTTTTTYGGLISGAGSLLRTNTGVLNLSGNNTYSGGTVISNGTVYVVNTAGSGLGSGFVEIDNAGILYLGNNTASGWITAPSITNTCALYGGSAGLYLDRWDNFTLTNYLTGSGQLFKLQSNTVTIATGNSYQGYTTISGGILRIAHPSALGTPHSDGKAYDTVVSGAATGTGFPPRLELSNNITVGEYVLLGGRSAAAASLYLPSHRQRQRIQHYHWNNHVERHHLLHA